ncbi:ATP-binding protein [Streptomyces sp. NPDC005438]|uniref:ATP-binding protein n=1 Tax=Streptomyces sp. NPDC005438 TaxID=3156880 RepID=UPI0033A737C7
MKQGTTKTLGAVALGAAFAAVGAGSASAADLGGITDKAPELTRVAPDQALSPVQDATRQLPVNAPDLTDQGQETLRGGLDTAQGVVEQTPLGEKDVTGQLLGGLPVANGTMPLQGQAQGLPLG